MEILSITIHKNIQSFNYCQKKKNLAELMFLFKTGLSHLISFL